jgi:glycolate oxidase FAD binding subunit
VTDYRPTDEAQLAEAVTTALDAGEPMELIGGGSKRSLGRPTQLPHRLELGAFTGIRSYEPAELVLTAGAATPLAEIAKIVAAANQGLGFEPPDWSSWLIHDDGSTQTIGGVLACNMSGPRRIRAGAARDHFLGFRGVSGRGEVFKAGGYVVKNVTGYDLSKLMAGSYGTLAALTEVTVKVYPHPETTASVALRKLDDGRALKAMTVALNSSHEVSGAAHLPAEVAADGEALTLLRLEGPVPSVVARVEALIGDLAGFGAVEVVDDGRSRECWEEIRAAAPMASSADDIVWRVSLTPSAAPTFIATLKPLLDFRHYYDWGGGLVWLALRGSRETPGMDDGGAALIRGALPGTGHATLIRAPAALRAAVLVFQPQAPTLAALAARVKDGFDPRRILNRGRMYSDL